MELGRNEPLFSKGTCQSRKGSWVPDETVWQGMLWEGSDFRFLSNFGRNSNYKDNGISWLSWVSLMHRRKIERLRVTDHQFKVNHERQRIFFVTERTENKVQDWIIRVAEDQRKLRAKLSPWCGSISWGNQWISWQQVDCKGLFPSFPFLLCNVILYRLHLVLPFSPIDDLFP